MRAKSGELAAMQREIIEPVRRAELSRDEAVVVGGAAMQLFGIKRTRDVDVVVTQEKMVDILGERVNLRSRERERFDVDRRGLFVCDAGQVIEDDGYGVARGALVYMLAPNDNLYRATFEELHDEAVEVQGVLVSPPERILDWKRGVGRPKDVRDIQLIEQYLARTPTA